MRNKQTLTKGEEEVMQALWTLGKGTGKEIIAIMSDPKPKYTTVATFLKILQSKGYVNYESEGKSYIYYPTISKDEHAKLATTELLNSYFGGSLRGMVSFFAQNENLSVGEIDELLDILEQSKK